jgi:hypothetical protein
MTLISAAMAWLAPKNAAQDSAASATVCLIMESPLQQRYAAEGERAIVRLRVLRLRR